MSIARPSLFLRSAAAAASSLAIAGVAPAAEPVNPTATADAKLAIMSLLAGTYSSECARGRGQEMPQPRSGSPIVFTADGTISWAGHVFDVTRSHVVEMGVTHMNGAFASKIDIGDQSKGERTAVAGVSQAAGQPAGASVTVGDDSATAPFGVCQGASPPGAGAPLWSTAVRLLGTAPRTASCIDMKTNVRSRAQVAFEGGQLIIGPHKYTPASGTDDSLSVGDGDGEIGYSLGAGGEFVVVTRRAGRQGLHFQVTPTNEPLAMFACSVE